MLLYSARDDRARPTRLRWVWLPEHAEGVGLHVRVWAGVRAVFPGESLLPLVLWFGGLTTLVVMALVMGPTVLAVSLFSPVSSTLIVLTLLLAGWLGRSLVRFRERTRRAMIRAKRCPSCTYELGDVEPGLDGCTQCPECGSAWNLNPPPPGTVVVVKPFPIIASSR